MEINWHDGVSPTSHGLGPFHPAIRNGTRVLFWPNITFATKDEATHRATLSLADGLQPSIDAIAQWNIYEAA